MRPSDTDEMVAGEMRLVRTNRRVVLHLPSGRCLGRDYPTDIAARIAMGRVGKDPHFAQVLLMSYEREEERQKRVRARTERAAFTPTHFLQHLYEADSQEFQRLFAAASLAHENGSLQSWSRRAVQTMYHTHNRKKRHGH
jgi:hypothetical protein